MYLEDLYNFFVSQNKNVKFSSKDSDSTIVVHIDEPITFAKEDTDDLNMVCPIRLCHTGDNINKSTISEKSMKDAIPSAYNMPILGYIYQDDNGEYQFAGHEFFVNENNEVEYEELPVGCIPESAGLQLVYDRDMDKTYLDGNGIIWRTYSKAADIIEREERLSCSVELIVDELSFDSKEKLLVIDKFRFSGVTILGKDRETGKDIMPGMTGANISMADFSEINNSIFSNNDKVIELLSALNEKLDNLNIEKFSGKEDKPLRKEFEDEAEAEVKETPTAEFDNEPDFYDGEGGDGEEGGGSEEPTPDLSDDPPAVDDPTPDPNATPDPDEGGGSEGGGGSENPSNHASDPTTGDTPGGGKDDDTPGDDDDDDDDEPSGIPLGQKDDDDTAGGSKKLINSIEYAVTIDGVKKEYAVTLKDKLVALSTLINDSYGEADGCYYDVDADEDTKTVIFHDYWNDKHYRQLYTVKKGVYSLKGDRTEVFATYLSKDEIDALENMKANYSSTIDELAQYKAEPEKLEILAEECYSQIADTDAYKKLSERETYFSMSVDEVRAEADKILLEFAKGHKVEFSAKEDGKKSFGYRIFNNPTDKKSSGKARYGGIFNK